MILPLLAIALANPAITPAERLGNSDWKARHAAGIEKTQTGGFEVAFLGDSITQGWEGAGKAAWDESFAPMKSANFGISGDSTQHVLWRLANGELVGANPKVIVMLIGTNNCPDPNQTPQMISEGVRAILDRLLSKTKAKILLMSVFPRDVNPASPQRIKIGQLNALIVPMADNKRVFSRDIGRMFMHPDDSLRLIMMPDQLHLSNAGYRLWALGIADDVRRLL